MTNEKIFKKLKVGDPLYIFDCSNMELITKHVVSVSSPYPNKGNMVVDVAVDRLTTYIFKASCELGFCSGLAISLDKSALMEIVEAQMASKERQVSKLKEIIEQLNEE